MLVIIPVSSADATLISPFSKAVRHFGKNSGHRALVVARPSDAGLADRLVSELGDTFDGITTHIFPQDGPSGWPKGPNFYWSSTVHYLQNSLRISEHWLWLELDSTPLRSGWLDAISTEYNISRTPFMGVIEKTHAVDSEGLPTEAGSHLVGVAVYPPSVSAFSNLWPYVAQMPTPFDVVCQWEFLPNTHVTELIQHCFRTQNYARRDTGEICGEDHNNFPNGIRFDRPLSSEAVLHHGCDDGSLSELLTGAAAPAYTTQPPTAKPEVNADLLFPTKKRAVRLDAVSA